MSIFSRNIWLVSAKNNHTHVVMTEFINQERVLARIKKIITGIQNCLSVQHWLVENNDNANNHKSPNTKNPLMRGFCATKFLLK